MTEDIIESSKKLAETVDKSDKVVIPTLTRGEKAAITRKANKEKKEREAAKENNKGGVISLDDQVIHWKTPNGRDSDGETKYKKGSYKLGEALMQIENRFGNIANFSYSYEDGSHLLNIKGSANYTNCMNMEQPLENLIRHLGILASKKLYHAKNDMKSYM